MYILYTTRIQLDFSNLLEVVLLAFRPSGDTQNSNLK